MVDIAGQLAALLAISLVFGLGGLIVIRNTAALSKTNAPGPRLFIELIVAVAILIAFAIMLVPDVR